MDELIERIVASANIPEDMAKEAVAIILDFLKKSGPQEKVDEVLGAIPEAETFLAENAPASGPKGLLGGLAGMMGGMGGAMAALNQLTNAGLGMGEIKIVGKALLSYAKEKAGADAVNDLVANIPGLNQLA